MRLTTILSGAEKCKKYLKLFEGKKSILQTVPQDLSKVNTCGLKYARKLEGDIVELSNSTEQLKDISMHTNGVAQTIKAEEKAMLELNTRKPKINIGKVFGKNIEELEVRETKLADGTIERIYTNPDNNKVLIKTHDNGVIHREWITGSNKADMIYLKQVGEETPYIVAKTDKYTQIYSVAGVNPDTGREIISHKQYYYAGDASLCRDPGHVYPFSGKVKVYDERSAEILRQDPTQARFGYSDIKEYKVEAGLPRCKGWGVYDPCDEIARQKVQELGNSADQYLLDLENLIKPFEV